MATRFLRLSEGTARQPGTCVVEKRRAVGTQFAVSLLAAAIQAYHHPDDALFFFDA